MVSSCWRVGSVDEQLADQLWRKAQHFIPDWREEWKAVGFSERLRFYRYDAAESFGAHYDGSISRGENEVSKLPFMVYLNGECDGGEIKFYHPNCEFRFAVRPERGKALVFDHARLHEGAPVVSGRKYVFRADVMYRRPHADYLGGKRDRIRHHILSHSRCG